MTLPMIRREVRALSDEKLNRVVAERIFGMKVREAWAFWGPDGLVMTDNPDAGPPDYVLAFFNEDKEPLGCYTTDWSAAGALVEKMRADGWDYSVKPLSFGPVGDQDASHHQREYDVAFNRFDDYDDRGAFAFGKTLPRATAEAAILALIGEDDEGRAIV